VDAHPRLHPTSGSRRIGLTRALVARQTAKVPIPSPVQ
jgi:hypothetical protein